ncbi:hypothetical protein DFH09DRAFT_1374056 [Mycena vulgaris]|nr:hypothetical protein DFH09DRAFT_1374056 [Mycena vulgaris]
MAPTDAQALALRFDDAAIWAPGQTVRGYVTINHWLALKDGLKEVRVDFRGSIETAISESGQYAGAELFKFTQLVWTNSSTIPNPSDTVEAPFHCRLPESLPPTFAFNDSGLKATTEYSIKVVGTRTETGVFNSNQRLVRTFTVFPAASPAELSAKKELQSGWGGAWRTVSHTQKLRRGMFGGYARVHAEFKIPDLPTFPRATAVAFVFTLDTLTKLMERGRSPEEEDIFPAPPVNPADVGLSISRTVNITGATRTFSTRSPLSGGLDDTASPNAVKCTVSPPEWIAEPGNKKHHGAWKRGTPTFQSEVEDRKFGVQYALHFFVKFPGMGNNVEFEVPLALHSGIE